MGVRRCGVASPLAHGQHTHTHLRVEIREIYARREPIRPSSAKVARGAQICVCVSIASLGATGALSVRVFVIAAPFVFEAHGRCLQALSSSSGVQYTGLVAAARVLRLPSALRRKLTQLDHAAAVVRHITEPGIL